MKEFPSCLGENGVQVADSSSSSATRAAQNVTCVYQCKLRAKKIVLLLSDMKKEACKKIDSDYYAYDDDVFIAKREHIYGAKAQFVTRGKCMNDATQFRGNHTVLVDGIPVEVFRDVHNWLFGNAMGGNAVLMFQTFISKEKVLAESQELQETLDAISKFEN
ncbi:hypothetical protein Lal_00032618, partial [Lupinus albus]